MKRIFSHLGLLLGIGTAVLFVLSAYSGVFSPEKNPLSAFMPLLFPILLAADLGFLLVWSFRRSLRLLIPLGALLLSIAPLFTYIPFRFGSETAPEGSRKLEILTYNVHNFGSNKPNTKKRPNPILAYIASRDADIVCLQEYSISPDEKHLSERQIRKALPQYPYYHFLPFNETFYRRSGIALFSKFPIRSSRRLSFPESKHNGAIRYELSVEGRPLVLINCHLESNKFTEADRRIYRDMVKNLDPDMLEGVKERLFPKMLSAARLRARQAETIAAEVTGTTDPVIVCGDFNDIPGSYIYRTIRKPLDDAYAATGFGPGITYHANGFWFRIDHLFFGNGLRAVDTQIDRIGYSDHYPLRATLALERPAAAQ